MSHPVEFDHIFRHLERVRWTGKEWEALCPAHDDKRPSLTVRLGQKSDELLIHCHAAEACSFTAIRDALSARAHEPVLFRPHNGKDGWKPAKAMKPEAHWDYLNEEGTPLYRVLKFRDEDGKKTFRQWTHDASEPDGFRKNMEGTRRVLYRLPALLENQRQEPIKRRVVCLVEGEKDADSLEAIGVLATTASGGAGKFHLTDSSPLAGCRVAVIPDVDPVDPLTGLRPGWDHAMRVANLLHGKAAQVLVVVLPVAEGQDISDWLAGLPHDWNTQQRKAALWRLVSTAPAYNPLQAGAPLPPFFREMLRHRDGARTTQPGPFHSPGEVLQAIDVLSLALRTDINEAKNRNEPVVADRLAHRLIQLAGECLRAAEDLHLLQNAVLPHS